MDRRTVLKMLALALPALTFRSSFAQSLHKPGPHGPFAASKESLRTYTVPEWFCDAKFGIWAHWGPQSAAENGDWYARNMYIQASDQYNYHVRHYGHPSKCGFKDIIPTWK